MTQKEYITWSDGHISIIEYNQDGDMVNFETIEITKKEVTNKWD